MIRSMTGFGAAMTDQDGAHFVVEVRSVNNKFFKASVRLPEELQGLEPDLEQVLTSALNRGSVTASVRHVDTSANAAAEINVAALHRYLDQLLKVPGLDHGSTRVDIGALLALPGAIVTETGHDRLERARQVLVDLTAEACRSVQAMRVREGRTLHTDLHKHCSVIAEHLRIIAERAPAVVEHYQQRLRTRMAAMLAEVGAAVRDEDLLREVAVFADRSDISEEVSRLQGHLEQFREIIDADTEEPAGRTLDFLSQEMLREANTIGSKCLDVDVSRRIVEIKGAIDRLKEQAQNVE